MIYDGIISPDFYGWVFPHGKSASVGMGTGHHGFDLKTATSELRSRAGLDKCKTIRKEGAPIPLRPLKRWDNGKDVLVAGDAAGVVAPSSGEGIYYAMIGGQEAAYAVNECIKYKNPKLLKLARKRFMSEHKTVFRVLEAMQNAYYKSDDRRERFVSLCKDEDVQRLTFESYMNKKLVTKKPTAHLKIMIKNVYCTKISSKIARTYSQGHGYKDLCKELLNIDISKKQQSSDWSNPNLSKEQINYAATDVIHLHEIREKLDEILERQNRRKLVQACIEFLPTRVELDLRGWNNDIFSHSS